MLYKYSDQTGSVVYATSQKTAVRFFDKDVTFCGTVSFSKKRLNLIRKGCDEEYSYIQRGIYKRKF